MCCPSEIKISSKYTPFTKFKPDQVQALIKKDLKDFNRIGIEIYWEGIIENIGVSNFNLQEYKFAKSILDKAEILLFKV